MWKNWFSGLWDRKDEWVSETLECASLVPEHPYMAISIGDEAGLEHGANILEVSALKLLQPTRPSGLTYGADFLTPSQLWERLLRHSAGTERHLSKLTSSLKRLWVAIMTMYSKPV